jgi:hypothetical protein
MMGAGARGVNLETLRLAGSGDLLHEVGRATITIQPEGGETDTLVVKYVVVWERDPAGGLALAVDMLERRICRVSLRLRGLLSFLGVPGRYTWDAILKRVLRVPGDGRWLTIGTKISPDSSASVAGRR